MNLVAGATGLLGTEICRQIAAQGKPVRALVRPTADPARRRVLESVGAEIAIGDLHDRASLDSACAGTSAVISTATTTLSRQPYDSIRATDLQGTMRLVDAAREAEVRQFVFISVASSVPAAGALPEAKRAVEAHLRASGLRYTILCPGPFMELWLGAFAGYEYSSARARVVGSGDGRQNWIALADVARFAVAALDNPAALDTTIDLGGPDWLSPNEVIRLSEELSGRHFDVEHVAIETLQAQLAAARDEYEATLAGLALVLAQGSPALAEISETAEAFGIRLTSVRDYLRSLLGLHAVAR